MALLKIFKHFKELKIGHFYLQVDCQLRETIKNIKGNEKISNHPKNILHLMISDSNLCLWELTTISAGTVYWID